MDFNTISNNSMLLITAGASVVSSLLGAVIGGRMTRNATMEATRIASDNQQAMIQQANEDVLVGFIWSIHDEIESIYNRYNNTVGTMLRSVPTGEALPVKYRTEYDYFPVYHSNSALVGKVKNHELRSSIINVYTIAKGMLDSYSIYWDLMTEHDDAIKKQINEDTPINAFYSQNLAKQLIDYTLELKHIDAELCACITALLTNIKSSYNR
ncbi:hypothetical protein [Aeromonas dhakensis]|uniref:hypothetical protein n=1 Tax=Aeromonas dhakensis TaxID=196024 RepID=UPI0012FE6148|nr:hypothetical protein [Aeromonas dhakensis]